MRHGLDGIDDSATSKVIWSIRGQIEAWESKGFAGIIDDAGYVHDRESLESSLSSDDLDAAHSCPMYGWYGSAVPFCDGRAVGLTTSEVIVGTLLQPTSLTKIREIL